MFTPYELFVGLRYTKAKRRNHFISFISLSSMLGIALGVTALITVLSVMNGFENELRHRILGMTAHATISTYRNGLNNWQSIVTKVKTNQHVVDAAPYIQKEGMLMFGSQVNGSIIRGVLPEEEKKVSVVTSKMIQGNFSDLKAGAYRIILGKDLARILNVEVGEKVTVVSPTTNVTIAGVTPRLKRFLVSGIFEVGMYEYDSAMAMIHAEDAQKLFKMGDGMSGVRVMIDDLYSAPLVSRQLVDDLPGKYWVRDWTQYHSNFFKAIKTEKTVMFVILLLIVAVAAFNIVSTLVMVVTDKESDIAILRTLGASPGSVMVLFIVQGTVIGLVGTLMGSLGGVTLALNVETIVPVIERLMGVEFMPSDVYYISDLPSELHWDDVIKITVVSFMLSIVATIYPAWRASKTQPAVSLRYE
jgi:lipoprotein-releasing system permease protein